MDTDVLRQTNIDNEVALRLKSAGAHVLCLGVPAGTFFAFDTAEYRCGPKFKGIKMIPPGLSASCKLSIELTHFAQGCILFHSGLCGHR